MSPSVRDEDEDEDGVPVEPPPGPRWPICGCGNRIFLLRPGRTQCARCKPMIFLLPHEGASDA